MQPGKRSVDINNRRTGIGKALIQSTINWAKNKKCLGIMLETQNINVPAVQFYLRCGFEVAGFDKYLYKGLDPDSNEIALFLYLHFW